MREKYKYAELDEGHIRILHLFHGKDDGGLQGTLRHMALEDATNTFSALSWTWGKRSVDDETQQIMIDGRPLSIWPALREMLENFREQSQGLDVWVDAICINQDKNKPQEKNSQIRKMADIYKAATEVRVWLGPSADDSDYIMKTIRNQDEKVYATHRFAQGLSIMLQRPWWARTWVLQEYVMNAKVPKVFCGQGAGINTELIFEIWRRNSVKECLTPTFDWKQPHFQTYSTLPWFTSMRNLLHNPNSPRIPQNLRNALLWLKSFQVTDPRDKVYAALGLITPTYREQFVTRFGVQTEKSIAEVYLDAMMYLLEYEKKPTVFYDFPVGRQKYLDAPSWVPNFNLDSTAAARSVLRLGDVRRKAFDIPLTNLQISDDRSTLYVRGHVLDRVSEVLVVGDETMPGWSDCDITGQFLMLPHLLHKIQDVVHTCRAVSNLDNSEKLSPEPLWRTLIAGCYSGVPDSELNDEAGCQRRFDELMAIPLCNFSEVPHNPRGFRTSAESKSQNPEVSQYCANIKRNMHRTPHILAKIQMMVTTGRTFFSGESGYYGLSEAFIRKGDRIVLLFPGHLIPFILRERGDAYEMVSVAYLPGPMMDAARALIERKGGCQDNFAIE